MEIQGLRYFVVAAEQLHFGRAAEILGIAQPALTQRIQSLEARLQVKLFRRANRRVFLTEAGKAFLLEARALILASERAVRLARNIDRGLAGELAIGYSGTAIFDLSVRELLRQYHASHPGVRLSLHEGTVADLIAALQAGRFDTALVRGPVGAVPKGIQHRRFSSTRLALAIPADHPWADGQPVSLAQFREEPFITINDPPGIGLRSSLIDLCQECGFAPQIALHAGSVMSVLGLVATGLGAAIVPDLPSLFLSPALHRIEIASKSAFTEIVLLTREPATSEAHRQFIALADSAFDDDVDR